MSRLTIASYPGGKSNSKKHAPLYQCVPQSIPYLVEPFAGMANFFLVIHQRVKKVWLNDKDPETFALLHHLNDEDKLNSLIGYIQSLNPVERDHYYYWKKLKPNSLLQSAVRKLIILNCSVSGAGGGYSKAKAHRKWYENKPKVWKQINKLLMQKQARITNLDYSQILTYLIKNNNTTDQQPFVYLDPPYFEVARKSKLYGIGYNDLDWNHFFTLINLLKIPFLISNRDAPEMRSLFAQYHLSRYNSFNDMNNTQNKNPELLVSNLNTSSMY